MDLEEKWQKVMAETRIVRFYRYQLSSHQSTVLPYIFLGPSQINIGDTVVRKGKVVIDRPMIFLPKNIPQFSGFDFEEELGTDANSLGLFLMVRGVNFPSLKYRHEISTIDICEQDPECTLDRYRDEMASKEDLVTGVVFGPTDCWQLTIMLYVSILISRSSPTDLDKFIEELRRRFGLQG